MIQGVGSARWQIDRRGKVFRVSVGVDRADQQGGLFFGVRFNCSYEHQKGGKTDQGPMVSGLMHLLYRSCYLKIHGLYMVASG